MHVTASAWMVTVAIKPLTLGPLPVGRGEGILRRLLRFEAKRSRAVFDHSFHFFDVGPIAGTSRRATSRRNC
jgi:hypothetical protein